MFSNLLKSVLTRRSISCRNVSTQIYKPSNTGKVSPYPVITLGGPLHSSGVFDEAGYINDLTNKGYNVISIDLYKEMKIQSLDDMVHEFHNTIENIGYGKPPIAIAHSFSSYFLMKYLESFPLSALVSLSPVPLNLDVFWRQYFSQLVREDFGKTATAEEFDEALAHYFSAFSDILSGECEGISNACPNRGFNSGPFLRFMRELRSSPVNMEKNAIPYLSYSSGNDPMTGVNYLLESRDYNGLDDNSCFTINGEGKLLPNFIDTSADLNASDRPFIFSHSLGLGLPSSIESLDGFANPSSTIRPHLGDWISQRF